MAVSSISASYMAGAPSLIAPPQLLRAHHPSSLQLPRRSLAIAAAAAKVSPKSRRPRRRGVEFPELEEEIQKFPSFDSLLENFDKLLFVEFYTTWCVPCRIMRSNLSNAARLTSKRVHFVRIDIDKNRGLAAKFELKVVPTYILFKKGKQVDRFEGAQTTEYYFNRIRTAFKRKAATETVDVETDSSEDFETEGKNIGGMQS